MTGDRCSPVGTRLATPMPAASSWPPCRGCWRAGRSRSDVEGREHLGGRGVVAVVLPEAEGDVGLVGVEAVVLQGVGVELVVEPDAAALLAQVEQEAADVGDPRPPPPAAAARSRTARCRARRRSGTRCAAGPAGRSGARARPRRQPSATCSRPSWSPSKVKSRASTLTTRPAAGPAAAPPGGPVAAATGPDGRPLTTAPRTVRRGRSAAAPRPRSGGSRQAGAVRGVPREARRPRRTGGARELPDEERRDHEVQLVGEARW